MKRLVFLILVALPVYAQTVGQVEQAVKAKPLIIGIMDFKKPVINADRKQIIADADFKTLQAAAKVDSAKTSSQYKVIPLSSIIIIIKNPDKGIIGEIIDFIIGR